MGVRVVREERLQWQEDAPWTTWEPSDCAIPLDTWPLITVVRKVEIFEDGPHDPHGLLPYDAVGRIDWLTPG